MKTNITLRTLYFVSFGGLLLSLAGCVSPGNFDQGVITRYQNAMVDRSPQPREAQQGLGLLKPAPGMTGPKLKVSKDAAGKAIVYLSLEEAIMRSLANNLDIQVVSFTPAMSREQVVKEAAAFDYVLFGGVGYQKTDLPTISTLGTTIVPAGASKDTQYQVGVKQTTVTGAQWQIAPTLTRTLDDSTIGPYHNQYEPQVTLQVTQPLLRNAWPEYVLANLHLAQLTYKTSVSQFRQQVEQSMNDVITAYWNLILARQGVDIQRDLLRKTIETRDRIEQRLKIDATLVELKQAEAAVESRRATLIRAIKTIGDSQDNLARLLADSQLNLLTKYEIIPSTPPNRIPVKIDPADQLLLALGNNPQLEQARLAIASAEINVKVAKNQTLPRLDLSVSTTVTGLDNEVGSSINNLNSYDYVGYSVSLYAEQPIGNRAALAELQRQKFNRLQAVTTMQNTADQIAVNINERIRQINTTFEEIQAQELSVKASAIQLQALQDTEEIRGRLTPEFLNTKLNAQESLANAQFSLLQAIVNYNSAMADLARVTGTILRQHGIELQKMPAVENGGTWTPDQGNSPAQAFNINGVDPVPTTSATTTTSDPR